MDGPMGNLGFVEGGEMGKLAITLPKIFGDVQQADFAKDIRPRQVKRLSRLIDDLLEVSRITCGKVRLRKEVVDAAPLLERAVESVRPLLNEREHRLFTSFERGRLLIRADPTRVEQVIVNLLTNAAQYTGRGGNIWLTGRTEGDQVVIRVRDDGIGIAPERLPEIFDPFVQGERPIARSEGGLGIGLTIVKRLVEMHDGRVTAASEGLGQGSEFVVRIPLTSAPNPAATGDAPTATDARKGSHILVVDDNVDLAIGTARILELRGHEVRTAHDGFAAIAEARRFLPEFVLLDIGLPGMDGYEVATRLRLEGGCRDAVIIAVTGYGQDEDRRRSKDAGFDHHLVKPVDFHSLQALLSDPGEPRT